MNKVYDSNRLKSSDSDASRNIQKVRDNSDESITYLEFYLDIISADRADKLETIDALNKKREEIEEDRAVRLEIIETLGKRLEESEKDRALRLELTESLGKRLEESEKDRALRLELAETLGKKLEESEKDRVLRLELAESLGKRLDKSEKDRSERLELIENLGKRLEESEKDRSDRLELIESLGRRLEESEKDRSERLELIEDLGRRLGELEKDRAARLDVIHELDARLKETEKIKKLALNQLPLVSVVTPVFNGGRWIERCIESIINQKYPKIEHIIIDGGSTDNTLSICSRYPHLYVHSSPDRGQSHAINKGFSMARGEILAWLCADDEYEAGAVQKAVKAILNGKKVVMGKSRFIDERGEVILEHPANQHPYYDHSMLTEFWEYTPISQPAVFWKREMWEACGPLRENLYFAMDYDLWMRMSRKTDFSLVDAYFARYRIHPDAKCFSDNYGSRIELIKVSRQYWPSRLKPRYWSLLFKYLFSRNSITQHYSDGQRYLDAAVNYLNAHKRLRAIACFCKGHLKHFRTPSLPGYRPVLKGVLAKGIGPRWFWRSGRRVFNFVFRRKIVRLVLYHSIGQSGSILLTAESEGYKNSQFRFWGKKGNEISLLRDWEQENIFQIHDPDRAMLEFGVHIRAGDEGDFIDQAWTVVGP